MSTWWDIEVSADWWPWKKVKRISDGMLIARESSAGVKLSISLTMRILQCMKGENILKVLEKKMHFSAAAIHFFCPWTKENVHILKSPSVSDISHNGVQNTAAVYLMTSQVTEECTKWRTNCHGTFFFFFLPNKQLELSQN